MGKFLENSAESENLTNPNSCNGYSSVAATHPQLGVKTSAQAVNQNSTDNSGKSFNGLCNKLAAIGLYTINANSYNNEAVNKPATINGYSKNLSTNNAPTLNVPSVSENSAKNALANMSTVNENTDSQNVMLFKKYHRNGDTSSTPSESGSYSNVSDTLYSGDQDGFTEVISKKKRNKNRQQCKKTNSYRSPNLHTESIKRDNGDDKKLNKKLSSTDLTVNLPSKNFSSTRTSGKSYLSALLNGQTGNSELRNGLSSDSQSVKNCVKFKSNDCCLPGAHVSVGQFLTNVGRNLTTNGTIAANYEQDNSSTVQMNDASAQTVCSNEIPSSQKECSLLSKEVILKQEKSNSIDDCIMNSTDNKEVDESSNATYCESGIEVIGAYGGHLNVANIEVDGAYGSHLNVANIEVDGAYGNDLNIGNVEFDVVNRPGLNVNAQVFHPRRYLDVVPNDGARGDSEVPYDYNNPYYCEFPLDKVKNLIGKCGRFKKEIEEDTGATFWVFTEMTLDKNTTVIGFMGLTVGIEKAIQIIEKRFPNITLKRWINPYAGISRPLLPEIYAAALPVNVEFMGVVSFIYTPNKFYVQQYGHPMYHSLQTLERLMTVHYACEVAPNIDDPLPGDIVAVPAVLQDGNTKWVRGTIMTQIDTRVIVKYLDYGGEVEIPITNIRAIKSDFLPFQFFATKCCLYAIAPIDPTWSEEAIAEFRRLCSGTRPPIFTVVGKVLDEYHVSITVLDDEINQRVNVAQVLLMKGFARILYPAPEAPEHEDVLE